MMSAISNPVQIVMAQNSPAPKLSNPTEAWYDFKAKFEQFIQLNTQADLP